MKRLPSYGFLLFIMLVMGCFFIYPIYNTVSEAFRKPGGGFTLEYVGQIFSNPIYREGLLNALKMAAGSTLGAMLLALPLAVLSARFSYPMKGVLGALVLVPLILPPFVGTIGVNQVLGQHGALNAFLMPGRIALGEPMDWLGNGRLFGVMERGLAGRDYLAGDYSIADMCCWTWIDKYPDNGGGLADFPRLAQWHGRIAARPAVQRALLVGPVSDEIRAKWLKKD